MQTTPPDVPDASSPVSTDPEGRAQPRISRLVAVVLVVASQLGAGVVLMIGFYTALCSLWGEECSAREDAIVKIATTGTVVLGFGGPFVVAWLRRSAVWALTPFVVVGLAWMLTVI